MELFGSNLTAAENNMNPTIHTSYGILSDPNQISRTVKWMYLLSVPGVTFILWSVWASVLRLYLLRRFYEKQGIRFVKNCYAVLGAEMRVSTLQGKNKSHD